MNIANMKVNHFETPRGYQLFDELHFSWNVIESKEKKADEVRLVLTDEEDGKVVYDSGILSDYNNSFLDVKTDLLPRRKYVWDVFVKAGDERAENQSWFETSRDGIPWKAAWIGVAVENGVMPFLFTDVAVKGKLKRASLYCCGLGLFECMLNGEVVGDEYLLPGYYSYDLMEEYVTFDLTNQLKEGNNILGAVLGEGWYKGRFVFEGGYTNLYGDRKKLIAELFLEYEDGTCEIVKTDENWQAMESHILENGIYDGEIVDYTREMKGLQVEVISTDTSKLIARANVPVVKTEEIPVVKKIITEDGNVVLDFGEMITGWVEYDTVKGEKTTLSISYGEIMQNGNFYRDNLRTARAEFICTLNGEIRTVRPHFTYCGFRYIKIEGLKEVDEKRFHSYRLMSDLQTNGHIKTEHKKLNQLIENAFRSQKCNFIDIPLDCPQRDERMGWTGDIAIFAKTACYNMDSSAFLNNYLWNLEKEQNLLNGAVPFFVPYPKVAPHEGINPFLVTSGACTWGDAATIVPWELYKNYKDKAMLRRNYGSMRHWTLFEKGRALENKTPYLWQNDRQLGDWLALDNPENPGPIGKTDMGLIASAYYYNSTKICYEAARVLGIEEDIKVFHDDMEKIRKAFIKEYLTEAGEIIGEKTQTAYAVILYFGLYEMRHHSVLVKGMMEALKEYSFHLSTGFVGTGMMMQALSENGMHDQACTLLLQESYPSWLYEVNLGATSIWERWNSLGEDGLVSDTGMNSLNHYAYGCVVGWIYEYICGFSQKEGYDMYMKPMPDRRLGNVSAFCTGVHGTYKVKYSWNNRKCNMHLEIPFGAHVFVELPDGACRELESGSFDLPIN